MGWDQQVVSLMVEPMVSPMMVRSEREVARLEPERMVVEQGISTPLIRVVPVAGVAVAATTDGLVRPKLVVVAVVVATPAVEEAVGVPQTTVHRVQEDLVAVQV